MATSPPKNIMKKKGSNNPNQLTQLSWTSVICTFWIKKKNNVTHPPRWFTLPETNSKLNAPKNIGRKKKTIGNESSEPPINLQGVFAASFRRVYLLFFSVSLSEPPKKTHSSPSPQSHRDLACNHCKPWWHSSVTWWSSPLRRSGEDDKNMEENWRFLHGLLVGHLPRCSMYGLFT